MDLKLWREQREQGEPFELSSGLVVRLKRVSVFDLAEQGEIPAPLVGLVEGFISSQRTELSLEEFGKLAPVINLVVSAAMVDPPVAEEPDDDHLGITELPMTDRLAMFNWANSVTTRLRPFRPEAG